MLIPLEGVEEHSFTEREIVIHNAKYDVICAEDKPNWYEE